MSTQTRSLGFFNKVVVSAVPFRPTSQRHQQAAEQQRTPTDYHYDAMVTSAVHGNRAAIAQLLTEIQPAIIRYCRGRIGQTERSYAGADDVAQEVCLAVLTALPTYQNQGRPFLAFVYGIARHKVADMYQRMARDLAEPVPELPDLISVASPEQDVLSAELRVNIRQLLQLLSPKQREIVILRVVLGLSAEETAHKLSTTPGSVRVAQHRALQRLRRLVGARNTP